jgi:hypothetical protein
MNGELETENAFVFRDESQAPFPLINWARIARAVPIASRTLVTTWAARDRLMSSMLFASRSSACDRMMPSSLFNR